MTDGDAAPVWVHASAAVVGEWGVLVRGPSGAGKTTLALDLVDEGRSCGFYAALVGDDRIGLFPHGERVVARPHPRVAGLVERRDWGIAAVRHEPACVLRLVLDLAPPAGGSLPRLPAPAEREARLAGVTLPLFRAPLGATVPTLARLVVRRLLPEIAGSAMP